MPYCYIICRHDRPEKMNRALVEGIVFPALVAEHLVLKDAGRHEREGKFEVVQVTKLCGIPLGRWDEGLRGRLKGYGVEARGGGSVVDATM